MQITERRVYFVETIKNFRNGVSFRDIGPSFEVLLRQNGIKIECVISAVEVDWQSRDNYITWEVVTRCPV